MHTVAVGKRKQSVMAVISKAIHIHFRLHCCMCIPKWSRVTRVTCCCADCLVLSLWMNLQVQGCVCWVWVSMESGNATLSVVTTEAYASPLRSSLCHHSHETYRCLLDYLFGATTDINLLDVTELLVIYVLPYKLHI